MKAQRVADFVVLVPNMALTGGLVNTEPGAGRSNQALTRATVSSVYQLRRAGIPVLFQSHTITAPVLTLMLYRHLRRRQNQFLGSSTS